MSRWYQNGLTGEQVEVKTFEEEDQYLDTQPWSRIAAPPEAATVAEPTVKELKSEALSLGVDEELVKKAKKKADILALIESATPEHPPEQAPPEPNDEPEQTPEPEAVADEESDD